MSSQDDKQILIHDLMARLEEILRRLRPGIPEEWFTIEFTMPQLRILFVLLREGRCRMSDLASLLGTSVSNSTGLVDKLVDKGLVERWTDVVDRRSVICGLSYNGKGLAERLLQLRRSKWEEKLEVLSEQELDSAAHGVDALLQGLTRTQGESQPQSVAPEKAAGHG